LARSIQIAHKRREQRHLAAFKRLVDEKQWPWTQQQARALMRHFADVRAIDRLGKAADFSLLHGATELAAEQLLTDIAVFEAKSGGCRTKR
jgi:hypothetical protein